MQVLTAVKDSPGKVNIDFLDLIFQVYFLSVSKLKETFFFVVEHFCYFLKRVFMCLCVFIFV